MLESMKTHSYFFYIVSDNIDREVFYVGMTGSVQQRICEHKMEPEMKNNILEGNREKTAVKKEEIKAV